MLPGPEPAIDTKEKEGRAEVGVCEDASRRAVPSENSQFRYRDPVRRRGCRARLGHFWRSKGLHACYLYLYLRWAQRERERAPRARGAKIRARDPSLRLARAFSTPTHGVTAW